MKIINILMSLAISMSFASYVFAFEIHIKNATDETIVPSPSGRAAGIKTGPMMRGEMPRKGIAGKVLPKISGNEKTSRYVKYAGALDVTNDSVKNQIKVAPGGVVHINFQHFLDKLVCFDPKGFSIFHKTKDGWKETFANVYVVDINTPSGKKLSETIAKLSEAVSAVAEVAGEHPKAKAVQAVAEALPGAVEAFEDPTCGDQRLTLIEIAEFEKAAAEAGISGSKFALVKFD